MEDRIFIDTTFYDERIDYYMEYEDDLLVSQEECEFDKGEGIPFDSHNITSYKGYGDIDFWIDVEGLKFILDFWRKAKEWYILRESKRMKGRNNE